MEMHNKFNIRLLFTAILSIALVLGCVSKKNIKVPLSDPLPHPKLAQMQSMSIEEKDGGIYFGQSKKYQRRGITVVSLKGDPYESGYAHGVLLKNEITLRIRELIYYAKTHSFGTSLMENMVLDRAREIEQYIPEKYLTELKGLAAGSGINFEYILIINTLGDTARAYSCTSVAVKRQDGKLIRSRSLEFSLGQSFMTSILLINKPSEGYAFASVTPPGTISTMTAINETGLNIGAHNIWRASSGSKGVPNEMLYRKIIENANSTEKVGEILKQSPRTIPMMIMATDVTKARIYEYNSEDIGYKDMDKDRLILTNYTQVLDIGAHFSSPRYESASNYLDKNQDQIDVSKLVELNRSASISWVGKYNWAYSIHLAIFMPDTLDFWIAVDPPPASRGRWVGFNLKKELDGSGHEPRPLVIPAM